MTATPQVGAAGSRVQASDAANTVSVIGTGAWGTALALIATRAGRQTLLWGRRGEQVAALREARENARYLPGITLPPDLSIGGDLSQALASDIVIYAQPAQHFRAFCRTAKPHLARTAVLVICAKGIELGSGRLLTEIAAEELPGQPVAVLSGPSFAAEAARGLPTAVAIAATEDALSGRLMHALSHAAFRPYGAGDPVGVEIAGATKNVLAIACGIVIGHGLGENARAALITRGLAEVTRLALAKGGRAETLMGLAGFGDLILTCCSLKSRNTSLGHELGEGKPLAEILAHRHTVAEGVTTAAAVTALAAQLKVDMPLCRAVDDILAGRAGIKDAIQTLLSRPLKREF